MRTGDFGILSQEPCGPPCFQGITPGVTSFDEAALIFKSAGFPCRVDDAQGKRLLCSSGRTQIMVTNYRLCTLDSTAPMVGAITLTPPDKLTVGEFITQYGLPDSVLMAWGPQSALLYASLQTFVFFTMPQGEQSYTLTPDTTIEAVIYVTDAGYQTCLQTAAKDRQQWKGYGAYQLNP